LQYDLAIKNALKVVRQARKAVNNEPNYTIFKNVVMPAYKLAKKNYKAAKAELEFIKSYR